MSIGKTVDFQAKDAASTPPRPCSDLHRITLGALIIALGVLFGDAIIAFEIMVVKQRRDAPER